MEVIVRICAREFKAKAWKPLKSIFQEVMMLSEGFFGFILDRIKAYQDQSPEAHMSHMCAKFETRDCEGRVSSGVRTHCPELPHQLDIIGTRTVSTSFTSTVYLIRFGYGPGRRVALTSTRSAPKGVSIALANRAATSQCSPFGTGSVQDL